MTLGKRIVAQRKRLGLTQDALAERLGVTAQAVSKWENDQSCPDITMLPKLAEVFGISTDELLGLEKKEIHLAEVVTEEKENGMEEPNGLHVENGTWELKWDDGQKSNVGIALWVLLVGGLMLAANILRRDVGFWDILWPSGLLLFGLFGLHPRFSFFRLGCALFGGYFLLSNFIHLVLNRGILIPICLLLFGLSLLFDALRKPKYGQFHVNHNGKIISSSKNYCSYNGERFDCATAFGENDYLIQLSRLSGGIADVSFGELKVDLSGCDIIAEDCSIELNCSFGELEILVPRKYRTEQVTSTAFASVDTKGSPDPAAATTIHLECNVSFGEITIRYI